MMEICFFSFFLFCSWFFDLLTINYSVIGKIGCRGKVKIKLLQIVRNFIVCSKIRYVIWIIHELTDFLDAREKLSKCCWENHRQTTISLTWPYQPYLTSLFEDKTTHYKPLIVLQIHLETTNKGTSVYQQSLTIGSGIVNITPSFSDVVCNPLFTDWHSLDDVVHFKVFGPFWTFINCVLHRVDHITIETVFVWCFL